MSELEQLLAEFKADYEAGRAADVVATLRRAPADERQELAAMLDTYLMSAPPRRWDPAAYEGSLAKLAVDRVYESIEGVSGTWPELLPRLRTQARIKRKDLVERLASALGFSEEPQVAKIGDYYNRMEHGRLPSEGVSDKVIAALAGIVDSTAEAIRTAGARSTEEAGAAPTFARTAFPDAEFADERLLSTADADEAIEAHDEIDTLFRDG